MNSSRFGFIQMRHSKFGLFFSTPFRGMTRCVFALERALRAGISFRLLVVSDAGIEQQSIEKCCRPARDRCLTTPKSLRTMRRCGLRRCQEISLRDKSWNKKPRPFLAGRGLIPTNFMDGEFLRTPRWMTFSSTPREPERPQSPERALAPGLVECCLRSAKESLGLARVARLRSNRLRT